MAINIKLVAAEKVVCLENAINNLNKFELIIIFVSWIWTNLFIIKTKQWYWLWMPFLFVVYVSIEIGIIVETVFKFKQDNGMWNGIFFWV